MRIDKADVDFESKYIVHIKSIAQDVVAARQSKLNIAQYAFCITEL